MRVLIVSATEFEIAPFLQKHPLADCLITGVGAAVSMYHLVKKMHDVRYDLIIQAGVAGTLDASVPLETVVMVEKDRFADVGVFEKKQWIHLFQQGLADANQFPFENGWLCNPIDASNLSHLPRVKGHTVNMLTDDSTHIHLLVQQTPVQVESMEGAALHYVCLQEKISFIQLRAISNLVGERNKSKWKLPEAIQQLNKELISAYEFYTHSS